MLPVGRKRAVLPRPYELFGDSGSARPDHRRRQRLGYGLALKYGQVGHVDAVEIDPVIARLGRLYHPEQPFSDPRVTVHIDDGRSFLRKSTDKYDLIIFALPDSLTLTSQFASLRLESFLFTEESFRKRARS